MRQATKHRSQDGKQLCVAVALIASLLLSSGCATTFTMDFPDRQGSQGPCTEPYIYSGTQFNGNSIYYGFKKTLSFEKQSGREYSFLFAILSILDFPFSLVLDTLFLPITIPLHVDNCP